MKEPCKLKKHKAKSRLRVFWMFKAHLHSSHGTYLFPVVRKGWERGRMVRVRVTEI
jgi:hypothetical protein